MRTRATTCIGGLLSLVALAAAARGQDGITLLDQRAERVTWLVKSSPAAGPALGGVAGVVASRAAQHEDLLVLQAGPREDARVVVEVERPGASGAAPSRYTIDLRAESLVVFVAVGGAAADAAPRAVYAEGFVRLVVESGEGNAIVEADELMIDLVREQAFVRNAEVRARPRAMSLVGGQLKQSPLLFRATHLRALGAARVVAEDVLASPCDHGAPHFALTARRIEVTATDPGAAGPLFGPLLRRREDRGGSDTLRRARTSPRWGDVTGLGLEVVPPFNDGEALRLPFLPFAAWRSDWPLPSVRLGRSSRLGNFAIVELGHGLVSLDEEDWALGKLDLGARERVEYYSERGTGGEVELNWDHESPGGLLKGDGHVRAFGIKDRADEDRVGTSIETERRFWLRGLAQEQLPGGVQVDAEFSRLSDRGVLFEYFRRIAQIDKEQETYAYARWAHDELALRAISRFRINDFQTQLEQLPEVKLDWIHAPLVTHETLGGVYLDVAARAGQLRLRFDDDLGLDDHDAFRADVDTVLSYKNSLGPLVLRVWGGGRETAWSDRVRDGDSIDRFAAQGGWNLATTLWKEFDTPWGVVRHEVVPEVGSRHVTRVTRDPAELLPFDLVEDLVPTDHLFLRLRTRLLTDLGGVRHKLLDVALESRYFPRDRGRDRARAWSALLYDVRLAPTRWLTLRARGEHDFDAGRLTEIDVTGQVALEPIVAAVSWRDLPGVARAIGWSLDLQLTPAWMIGFSQQYDFVTDEFLFHRGRVVRTFHCLSLEVALSHDPQQRETTASFALGLAPLLGSGGPFERDRWRELY